MSKFVFVLFFVLVVFGLVMLASAGVVEGQDTCGTPSCLLIHQIKFGLLPGLLVFFVFSKIPYLYWQKFALPLLLVAIGLMALVFMPGIGVSLKGAQRWIDLGITTFQPAESLKFALVIYLAAWFGSTKSRSSLIPFFLVLILAVILLALQPDFGTLGIVLLIGLALYYFSGAKWWHFLIFILAMGVFIGGMALAAPYRFNRVKTFFNPEQDTQGTSYHIHQAIITIGSGGVWGLGYGQSKQKFNYLPEPVGDSIFAVVVEELGFVGGTALVGLFLLLIVSLAQLARHAPDTFSKLLVLGVAVWIGGQAFINIAAISGIIPLTGVPLPLISYGSSSLVSLMGAMGIVRNIAKS